MLELRFAKEPFDFKLFILCFWKKIWLVLVAMVLGLVLVGGGNYLTKVVFGGPTQYEIESSYYVDYYMDPETGQIYTHINEATWKSWITTDWFVDRIWEHALQEGLVQTDCGVEKKDLPQYLSAALLTDVHIPTSYVVTPSPELTEILNKAVQLTFMDFGEQQEEILGVRVIDETTLQEKDKDDRTLRACVLGAVIGAFVACIGIGFGIIMDDSVKIPETFTYRYGIPMLGVLEKGEEALSEEALTNICYKYREKKNVAVLDCDTKAVQKKEVQPAKEEAVQAKEEAVQAKGVKVQVVGEQGIIGNVWENILPEGFHIVATEVLEKRYEALRQAEGVLLLVAAGMYNSKEIEHLLHELAVQDIEVQGALLYQGDAGLLRWYRRGYKKS